MNGAEKNFSVTPMNVMGTESPDPRGMLNFASGFLETAMQTPVPCVAPQPQTKKNLPRKRWTKDPEMVLVDFKKKDKHQLFLVLKELKVIQHEDEAAKLRKYIEGKSKEAEQEKETGDDSMPVTLRLEEVLGIQKLRKELEGAIERANKREAAAEVEEKRSAKAAQDYMDLRKYAVEDQQKHEQLMKEGKKIEAEQLKYNNLIEKKMNKTIAEWQDCLEMCSKLKAENDTLHKQLKARKRRL